jgi:hypothetical protein
MNKDLMLKLFLDTATPLLDTLNSMLKLFLDTATSLLNTMNSIWSALISDPIKSITAFASIGGLIIGWKNLKKDTTRVNLVVRRAQNGPLILQNPQEEFLLFEVYNQGISPVVIAVSCWVRCKKILLSKGFRNCLVLLWGGNRYINEVGIKVRQNLLDKPKLINLVDMPSSFLHMKGQENAIGTRECVGLPGTIPARSTGVFLLCYSRMRESSVNFQKRSISPGSTDFVGSQRVVRAFQEFQKLETPRGKCLQINPYILTGSGDHFFGKKAMIKLGNLGDAVAL